MWASSWQRTSSRRAASFRKATESVIVRVERLVRAQLFDRRAESRIEIVSHKVGRDQSSAYRAIDFCRARQTCTSSGFLMGRLASGAATVAADML